MPVITSRNDDGIDVGIGKHLTHVGERFGARVQQFGRGDSSRVDVTETTDVDAFDGGKFPHQTVGTAPATDEANVNFLIDVGSPKLALWSQNRC